MNKPIKLTEAQLTTLQRVADPNYKSHRYPEFGHSHHIHYRTVTLRILVGSGLLTAKYGLYDSINHVFLSDTGRAYLNSLVPPPKTDKERIAELEVACKIAMDFVDHVGEASPIVFGNEAHVYHVLRRALYPNAEEV